MIYLDFVSLSILENLSKKTSIKEFESSFSQPLFTTSDTGLNHRKVNELSNTGVIKDNRKNKMAWRKFGVVDVSLVKIADELVSYGYNKNSQLKAILDFLVENGIEIPELTNKKKYHKFPAFIICGILTMTDIPSYLVITKQSIVGIFDFMEYKKWVDSDENNINNYLVIRMDKIIAPILKELDDKIVGSKPENRRITEIPVSKQEIRALQLIHSGKFTKIEIRLGDGDIGFIKAINYTTIRKGEKSATEIGKIVTSMSKHHTVSVYGDDGNVIKLQHTQTFKV